MQIEFLGNSELLNLHKVAFFCFCTVSSRAILRCYDWATQIDAKGKVVIGGFQSQIEKMYYILISYGKCFKIS